MPLIPKTCGFVRFSATIVLIVIITLLSTITNSQRSAAATQQFAKDIFGPCQHKYEVSPGKRSLTYALTGLICILGVLVTVMVIVYVQLENKRLISFIRQDYLMTLPNVLNYGKVDLCELMTTMTEADNPMTYMEARHSVMSHVLPPISHTPPKLRLETPEVRTERVYDITEQRTEGSLVVALKQERKDYEKSLMEHAAKLNVWKEALGLGKKTKLKSFLGKSVIASENVAVGTQGSGGGEKSGVLTNLGTSAAAGGGGGGIVGGKTESQMKSIAAADVQPQQGSGPEKQNKDGVEFAKLDENEEKLEIQKQNGSHGSNQKSIHNQPVQPQPPQENGGNIGKGGAAGTGGEGAKLASIMEVSKKNSAKSDSK